ncbi:hypothetical protein [Brevibacterium sp.]|uniref:hypothetical protein n=1 Tax=Brevibacterium sp. TaxID=1701 RepID=UPI0025BA1FEF|nr:hypothetical protein [Brevibacterium sp.]
MSDTRAQSRSRALRLRLLPVLGAAVAVTVLLNMALHRLAEHAPAAPGDETASGFLPWLDRFLGDMTEAQFYGSALAGAAMLAGAALAHALAVRRSRARGFDISYGTGLWPWVLVSALTALLLSHLLWSWTLEFSAWQPIFVPFVSVAPAIVLIYGRGWATAVTAAVLAALLTTPVALVLVDFVLVPAGLPVVIGNVASMWAGALIAFALCRALPWMRLPEATEAAELSEAAGGEDVSPATTSASSPAVPESDDRVRSNLRAEVPAEEEAQSVRPLWLPRRALADFTEPQFYGNEWASLGMIAGVLLAWFLGGAGQGPLGLVPDILTAQLLTALLAVWICAGQWQSQGWYPTFVPIVSFVPAAVIEFGGGWAVIVSASVLGALTGPYIGRAIARRLPADFHPFIGSVMSMTIITLAGVPLLRLVL